MTIKHLVFGGGGPSCFLIYGAVRELNILNYWNIDDIQSIYGCSSGAWLGLLISLGFDWETLDTYLIKRPWEKMINIGPTEVINSFSTKGLVSSEFIANTVKPVLQARDLDVNCTFLQHYEATGIEIHFYTVDINTKSMSKVDLSYKTHPDLKIVEGLSMTMAVPILIVPFIKDNCCYIDGGVLNNFPLRDCIEQQNNPKNEEILAFKANWQENTEVNITNESNLLQYISHFIRKLAQYTSNMNNEIKEFENLIVCNKKDPGGPIGWIDVFSNENARVDYINSGKESAMLFLNKKLKKNNQDLDNKIENFEIISEGSTEL